MKDVIRAAVVNFKAEFGDKRCNLDKMIYYVDAAAAKGADILVLPELCLTGYDVFSSDDVEFGDKAALCETADGEAVHEMSKAVKSRGVMTIFGFAEKAGNKFYNSAAAVYPKGDVKLYRKLHLFGREGLFFKRGNSPLLMDTPWGKTGLGICYDTYNFPELLRYYAAKGTRLYLNPTAMAFEDTGEGAKESFCNYYRKTLEYNVINTGMFILSSNLTGFDGRSYFGGGSVVMGVGNSRFKRPEVKYYAGSIENDSEGIFCADIDLSMHNPRLFAANPVTGEVDFRPEFYVNLYKNL